MFQVNGHCSAEDGLGDQRNPLPESVTFCGLLLALSLIESEPVARPGLVGSNRTPIAQLEPGLRLPEAVQVVVAALIENWLDTLKPSNTKCAALVAGFVIVTL
jgi:hypothetical protein